jgi:hypothetical protein
MGDDRWTAGGNSGDIQYEVGSLTEFAARMQERLTEFQNNVTNGVAPMMMVPMPGSQLAESELFGRAHRVMQQASRQLMREVMEGLMALNVGATSVENQYADGDAMAAATNNAVFDTFYPTGNNPTLRDFADGGHPGQNGQPGQPGEGGPTPTAAEEAAAEEHAGADDRPDENQGESSILDGQTVAEGESGEYHVPADDEGLADAPDGPDMPD